MKQGLIDKFVTPFVKNLGEARELNVALLALPESTFPEGLDLSLHPGANIVEGQIPIVRVKYNYGGKGIIRTHFPSYAKKCFSDGPVCSFEYKGINYQIN